MKLVSLGLLLAEVARKQNITVNPAELRNALMAEARRFPGQEKAVIDYYTQTQGVMERLRAPLLISCMTGGVAEAEPDVEVMPGTS